MKKINHLGQKSLSVFLRYLVNFLWYSQLIIVGLILIKFFANLFSSENTFSWPVSFVAKVQEDIVSQNPNILGSKIQVTEGTLLFDTMNDWHANAMMLLGVLIIAAPFLTITFQVRKILKSFVSNDPFLKSNLRRIKLIGIILMLYPIVLYIFGIGYTGYMNSNFVEYDFVNNMDFWPLFFGLFTLVISEVFRLGIEYREDNNLTI